MKLTQIFLLGLASVEAIKVQQKLTLDKPAHNGWTFLMQPQCDASAAAQHAEQIVKYLDEDDNGEIERSELDKVCPPGETDMCNDIFNFVDCDDSGSVSPKELEAAIKKYPCGPPQGAELDRINDNGLKAC